jgi:hypothetical protein
VILPVSAVDVRESQASLPYTESVKDAETSFFPASHQYFGQAWWILDRVEILPRQLSHDRNIVIVADLLITKLDDHFSETNAGRLGHMRSVPTTTAEATSSSSSII